MAWPYLTGTIKIVISYTIGGKVAVNVVFAKVQGGGPVTALLLRNAANAARDAWEDQWADGASNSAEVVEVSATDWSGPGGGIDFTTGSLPVTGVLEDPIMPNQVAMVVTTKTGLTGRSNRGRAYFPGLSESRVTVNIIDSATVTDFTATFTDLIDNLALVGIDLIVYSLYTGGAERETPVATVVTQIAANTRVDTQRRRLPS